MLIFVQLQTFLEFLHSLDDLPDRAKLAVPELELPRLTLSGYPATGEFKLIIDGRHKGFARVMLGLLRAIADDYGALVLLEDLGGKGGEEEISIVLVESSFADGRDFSLAGPAEVGT